MPQIRIKPLGLTVEAQAGQTIMEAAGAHGLYWPTTCGGQGICTTCACTVHQGQENLSAMGRGERKTLTEERGAAVLRQNVRLACQARVYADVEVEKPGVRPAEE